MNMWPHPVGKFVGRDGCLTFGQRRFWSADSVKFAGRCVSVRLPGAEDQMVTFWQGDEEKARKYVAHLIADAGFADKDVAEAVANRLRHAMSQPEHQAAKREAAARRASIVRLQAELLLQLLGDRQDHARSGVFAIMLRKAVHQVKLLKQHFVKAGQNLVESEADGDLQSAQTFEARLRLAERIFEIGQFGFSGHIESPAVAAGDASEAYAGAHRLCGGAE